MRTGEIRIHDAEGFEGMRKAGRLTAECLDMLVGEVKPGVTTQHLDDLIRDFVLDHGAQSATIGYRGYRHASCISLNHVICHGIPGAKPLKEGDIANIDVTCILDGWHGDHSREPNVVHSSDYGTGPELRPGMFFTIEPMLNIGRKDAAILPDGWTAVTRDRQLSAQFEHSIGVTETGFEIFTKSPKGFDTPHTVKP